VSRVKHIQISGKEILSIDYSGCKAEEMIEAFNQAREEVLRVNGNCLILTNLANAFITPIFLRYAEQEMPKVKHLIKKNAFINMSFPQRMILKGFTLFIGKKDFVAFNTYEEAIHYLVTDDNTIE
jgi:hypothetical protein